MAEAQPPTPFRDFLKYVPIALAPVGETPRVNAEVRVYDGRLEVGSGTGAAAVGRGRCSFAWLPSPRITFELPRYTGARFPQVGRQQVQLVEKKAAVEAMVTSSSFTQGLALRRRKGLKRRPRQGLSGLLVGPAAPGNGSQLAHLLFHVPNFWSYIGAPVCDDERSHGWSGRVVVDAAPWHVTLDAVSNGSDLANQAKDTSGFALTHVGRLEWLDGAAFTSADGVTFLTTLHWFLSFARGFWTSPVLYVGFNDKGRRVWEQWDSGNKISRWRTFGTWFNDHMADGFAALPGFVRRHDDALWGEPLRLAVHWYTESNGSAGAIEGSIILTQAAFELLAHVLLVEDRKTLSADGFRKLPASDKMRGLLVACGIPISIPAECSELAKLANPEAPDGPGCFTLIRNALVHADAKNRRKLSSIPPAAIGEAWELGLWYLELVLLRLCDYSRTYSCRLVHNDFKGNEVRPVPWA
jgi:hypothetical protein